MFLFFQIRMKVAFCAINNETCRSLADRLLTQGIKVTFLCLDCFDIDRASDMINELKVVGREQGEHIKILLVVCELFYRVSHNERYKNILSKHLIESNIRPKVRWRILLVPGHFGILVINLKSEILGVCTIRVFSSDF